MLLGMLCLTAAEVRAEVITFDTSSLIGGGTFSLDLQFADGEGGIIGDSNNTVTLSGFNFGVGGSVVGAPILDGGASGNVSTTVSLTDSAFFNSLIQSFVAGNQLSFNLEFTANPEAGVTPDQFSFYIFGSDGLNRRTTDPFGLNALVRLDINVEPTTNVFALEATSPVPEPATMILLGTGLAGIGGMVRRRRKAKAV